MNLKNRVKIADAGKTELDGVVNRLNSYLDLQNEGKVTVRGAYGKIGLSIVSTKGQSDLTGLMSKSQLVEAAYNIIKGIILYKDKKY
jgi:hypothetical protein